MLKKARQYNLGEKVFHVRNQKLCDLHQHFLEFVKKGKYQESEFLKFVEDVSPSYEFG